MQCSPSHFHPHRKNLHLPEISDTDRDLDSSTIAYSSVSLSFCKLAPLTPRPRHDPPFGFLDAISAYPFEDCTLHAYHLLEKYSVHDQLHHTHIRTCVPVSAAPPTSRVINLALDRVTDFGKRMSVLEYVVQDFENTRDLVVSAK